MDVAAEAAALLELSQDSQSGRGEEEGGEAQVSRVTPGGAPLPPAAAARGAGSSQGRAHRGLAVGQVDRVVTASLPEGMHVSRDAKVALQKVATITLLYLACLADNERTQKLNGKQRSTLSVQDVRDALVAAGMGHLVPMMQMGGGKRHRE